MESDINTYETTWQPIRPHVVDKHKKHCERPECLNVITKYHCPPF